MAVTETRVRISLDDKMSARLKGVQKVTDNFSISLNNLGRAGAAVAAGFAGLNTVGSALGTSVQAGFELGVKMETAKMSISGVLMSMTKLRDRQLEWNEALGISDNIVKRLQKTAMETAATPTELVDAFSGLVGIGLGAGMNLQQIERVVTVGTSAVKAFGLQGYQLIQELRDLFAGNITTRASTIARALGVTNADINHAKEMGNLYEFLMERMKGFSKVILEFSNTYQGAMNVAQGATEQLVSNALDPLRNVLKDIANAYTGELLMNTNVESALNSIGQTLAEAVKSAKNLYDLMSGPALSVMQMFAGGIATVLSNIDLAAVGFFAWRSAVSAANTEMIKFEETVNTVLESIGEITARFRALIPVIEKPLAGMARGMAAGDPKDIISTATSSASKARKAILDPLLEEQSKIKAANELMWAFNKLDPEYSGKTLDKLVKFIKRQGDTTEIYGQAAKFAQVYRKLEQSGVDPKEAFLTTKRSLASYEGAAAAAKRYNQEQTELNQRLNEFYAKLEGLNQSLKRYNVTETERLQTLREVQSVAKLVDVETAENMITQIKAQAKAAAAQDRLVNKWLRFSEAEQAVLNRLKQAWEALPGAATSFGIAVSMAGDYLENEFLSKIGGWASEIGMLTYAFQGLWSAIGGPATVAVTAALAALSAVSDRVQKNIKESGFSDLSGYLTSQWGTKSEYEALKKAANTPKKSTDFTGLEGQIQLATSAGPKPLSENEAEKLANRMLRLSEDGAKIAADIMSKMTKRVSTKQEQDFANLNKELATFQDRINTLKASGGEGVQELQELLSQYSAISTKKINDTYDLLSIKGDELRVHILDNQQSMTSIIASGLDSLQADFLNFGQNLLTEGGSIMDRFVDLFKNFANTIINTLMKIYMNGILVKSLGIFGGSSMNTSWINASTENAAGTLSIGNFIVGHAKGGIATGWSLVGERGPELVNFSNPGRVYTAGETAKALGNTATNIKVELKNESGTRLEATQSDVRFDGEGYIVSVVLDAIQTNRGGMRSMIQGARA